MSYSTQAAGNVKQLFLTLCLAPDPVQAGRGLLESGVSGWRLRRPCPVDSGKNLVLFRETKLFQFGKHECPIDTDFKSTTAALDESGRQSHTYPESRSANLQHLAGRITPVQYSIEISIQGHSLLTNWRNAPHRAGTRHSSHFLRGRQATRAGHEAHHRVASEDDRHACSGRRRPRQLPSGFLRGSGVDGSKAPGQKPAPPFQRPTRPRQ